MDSFNLTVLPKNREVQYDFKTYRNPYKYFYKLSKRVKISHTGQVTVLVEEGSTVEFQINFSRKLQFDYNSFLNDGNLRAFKEFVRPI